MALAACGPAPGPATSVARAGPAGAASDPEARVRSSTHPPTSGRVARPDPASPTASREEAPPSPPARTPADALRGAAPAPVTRVRFVDDAAIAALVARTLAAGGAPGCVIAIGDREGLVYRRSFGQRAVDPRREIMSVDTIFDLASVTKAVATATSVMKLAEEGRIDLDSPVVNYLPQMRARATTVRHLLTHTAGLPSVDPLADYADGRASAIEHILHIRPETAPGRRFRYSDLGFILLGEVVARVTGQSHAEYARRALFEPLGMRDTMFQPSLALRARIAPTERAERRNNQMIRGVVHDPRAFRLGGIAGNAGLFSTVDDLSRFAQALLAGGELEGERILAPQTVADMTRPRPLPGKVRALGWDVARYGLSESAFGHGGFTGTALWIDPERGLFFVLLSNRVHPSGEGNIRPLLRGLGPLAVQAVAHARPRPLRAVRTGIDVLRRERFSRLSGRRVAVLTHRAGRARDGERTLDLLTAAEQVEVVRVFSPEHGLGSVSEGRIHRGRDRRTGLEVVPLFGRHRRPSRAALDGIDTLVVDLQDVGARFYTYGSTLRQVLEAAADASVRVMVLDRPNPLGGQRVEGPVLHPSLASFVNYHPLPVLHGLTIGELAILLRRELSLSVDLDVVRMEGWQRSMRWPATGLLWVPPSPNLLSPEAVMLYPAVALLEGTNVSVGRGTEHAFTVLGAPFMRAEALAAALADLPGVGVEATTFVPTVGPHRRRRCRGVRLTLRDRATYRPVEVGLAIGRALLRLYPRRWEPDRVIRMLGDPSAFTAWREGEGFPALRAGWEGGLGAFLRRRSEVLLYRPSRPEKG